MPHSLSALIFDFDGLIVDTESAIVEAWRAIHKEDGLVAVDAVLHALVGHVDVEADIWSAYPPVRDKAALDTRLRTGARTRMESAPLLPGVAELWAAASDAGLALAVASNSSHRHVDGMLRARGLLGRFSTVVCREDVARGKPAPDIYLEALRRLAVSASEAMAFEDSVPGHRAAHAAGLPVVVAPNPITRRDDFPHASLRVESLAEVTLPQLAGLIR
jgi:putative hydrolase of the HAD superfamily